jgi:hypothetical protein
MPSSVYEPDPVREDLAWQCNLLANRIRDLEADIESYRLVAVEALHALHGLTLKYQAQSERLRELTREYQEFRERIFRQDAERRAA